MSDFATTTIDTTLAKLLPFVDDVIEAVTTSNSNLAESASQYVRYELEYAPDGVRAEIVQGVKTHVLASANGQGPSVLNLLGIEREPITPQAENKPIRQALLVETLQAAAIEQDSQKRDELIYSAARTLANMGPLAIDQFAPEFKRLLGLSRRTFNKLIARAEADTKQTGEQEADTKGAPAEDELAARVIIGHPLLAYGLGEFREYNSARGLWLPVQTDAVRGWVMDVLVASKVDGVRPTSRLRDGVLEWVRVRVSVSDNRWNADPYSWVCGNGALNVLTRQLRPHSPDDYSTVGVSYDFDPEARAPRWEWFISTCLAEVADLLHEFMGYCLTTETLYEIALWLYGLQGTGKSTTIAGFLAVLGERAGFLGLADIERSRFALTNLAGKTLVVSSEQPSTYIHVSHWLNAIISGEPFEVERKYADPVTITPCAKILWAMNELPRVGDASNGLFRRVKVIHFPPLTGDPDPTLKADIAGEGAGILNWALDGLERLRQRGRFEIPSCVQSATDQFKQTNDIPAVFVSEKCITGPTYKAQSDKLYKAYQAWAIDTGHKPQSSTSLAVEWARLGFERYRAGGKTFWRGVGLLDD